MSSLKQRFLSGLLTFVMVFTMIPITNMVNPVEVEAANTTTTKSATKLIEVLTIFIAPLDT